VNTCFAHGWNIPCHRCALNRRIDLDRINLRWELGGIGGSIARKIFGKITAQRKASSNGRIWK
jgi:hypothetical protein